MPNYLLWRAFNILPVAAGITLVSFILIHLAPGDPATTFLGMEADAASVATLRERLGLDRSWAEQYLGWLGRVLSGDLGRSTQSGRPVFSMMLEALAPTALLAGAALAVSLAIAIPAGMVAATHRNSALDWAISFVGLCGLSLPSFLVAILLILTFTVYVPMLPASGYVSPTVSFLEHLRHLILPALTLAAALGAATMRITRAAMRDELGKDYVRTARAKGLSRGQVVCRHVFPNAGIPVLTVLGIQLGHLLGGVVITETVFSWPGVGKLTVDAIFARDYPVLQGSLLLTGAIFTAISLIVDVIYTLIDPRVRYA
jgi:peptide/nickel transport system permease protein